MVFPAPPRDKFDGMDADKLLGSSAEFSEGELEASLPAREAASWLYCLSHVLRNVCVSINVLR